MAAAYRESSMGMGAKSPEPAHTHSPWHSPVPYLFGGLAAMLGLIAFALLILACSYWKLSGFLDESHEGEPDLEAGEANKLDGTHKPFAPVACEPKFLVIMPGQEKPTCLATPASSNRSSSFAGGTCTCDNSNSSEEMTVTQKQDSQSGSRRDQVQHGNTETQSISNDQNC